MQPRLVVAAAYLLQKVNTWLYGSKQRSHEQAVGSMLSNTASRVLCCNVLVKHTGQTYRDFANAATLCNWERLHAHSLC